MINKTKDLNIINNNLIINSFKEMMIENNSIGQKKILIDLKIYKIQIDMIINNRANSFIIIIINSKEVKINLSNLSNNRNNFNNNNNNPFSSNLSILKIISQMES